MTLKAAAIDYIQRGWTITPLRPLDKRPVLTDWPVISRRIGESGAEAIWSTHPDANIGLVTGLAFDVLDIDGTEGKANFDRFHGRTPYKHAGPMAQTGGGGYHLYFGPTGEGNRGQMLPKVDYRGVGGQVVAPPSIHPNGTPYRWLVGHGPEEPLSEAPDWLWRLLRNSAAPDPVPRDPTGDHDRGDVMTAFIDKGVRVRRDGPRFKARCYTGLHNDSDWSLTIYPTSNDWYCFGCQAYGDAGNVKDGSYVRQGKRWTTA